MHLPHLRVLQSGLGAREMPFWKANPDMKPRDAKDFDAKPLGKEFFVALKKAQESFKDLNISDEEWLEQIKD